MESLKYTEPKSILSQQWISKLVNHLLNTFSMLENYVTDSIKSVTSCDVNLSNKVKWIKPKKKKKSGFMVI